MINSNIVNTKKQEKRTTETEFVEQIKKNYNEN